MILKNKYLPLQNVELNHLQVEYLIKKIDYWLYGMSENYFYNFWHQGFLRWISEKEKAKRFKVNLIAEQLRKILNNLKEAQLFNNNASLSNDDLELINSVYKKMKFSLIRTND